MDLPRKESWSSFEYEYLDEDSDEEHVKTEAVALSSEKPLSIDNVKAAENVDANSNVEDAREWRRSLENYFIRSPSVSSCSSVASHSLGDLSMYGLEFGEDGHEFGKNEPVCSDSEETSSNQISANNNTHLNVSKFDNEGMGCSEDGLLNTTFVTNKNTDDKLPKDEFHQDFSGSLYDTCDSAISLSFTRRLQYSEDTSGPSSLTDTGTESPHFGDTWDSGCSVGRVRCRSDSSGHCSDMELENTRLGNTITRSLGDALNLILEKHNIQRECPTEKHVIENEKRNVPTGKTKVSKKLWRMEDTSHVHQDSLKDLGTSVYQYKIKDK